MLGWLDKTLPQTNQTTFVVDIFARMPVPKMVKNGLYSSFEIWGQFWAANLFCWRDLAKTPCFLQSLDTGETSLSNKPISDRNRQKKN